MSSFNLGIIVIIGLAVIVSVWRVVRDSRAWRWTRILAQFLMTGLLYLLLFPPVNERPRVQGIVLTPGVTAAQMMNRDHSLPSLALPGVEFNDPAIDRVPDLASGLRRHQEIGNIEILGDGLPPRDRGAVGDRGVKFSPGDTLAGVVNLQLSTDVRSGAMWSVRGQLTGIPRAHVELRDRSDATVASATADDEGRFTLSVRAKSAGQSLYRLRLVDAAQVTLEEIPLPLVVADGSAVRTLILAGAPDPELKYLRRWIVDSGNSVASRIGLSRGIEQLQNAVDLAAASLAEIDLLIADERAWAGLSTAEKAQIKSSVERGMGLILRTTGPLSSQVRSEWVAFGFKIESFDGARSVTLANPVSGISVSREPFNISVEDSVALVSGVDRSTLAAWRAVGQGRVALWLALDTYRLQLEGDDSRYGTLWSDAFAAIARARGIRPPLLPTFARVEQRSEFCQLDAAAALEDTDGQIHDLLVGKDSIRCAAWWPMKSGWHAIVEGPSRWPFYVYSADDAKTLKREETREATSELVQENPATSSYRVPMQRWPWFLVWLLICAGIWWLERKDDRQSFY